MNNSTTDAYRGSQFVRHLGPFELEMARRDILFYYDEQTNYATISAQLSFGKTLNLPYWDYLDLRGAIDEAEKHLIRRGSLLLLLSASLEFFDDLGTYYLIDEKKLVSVINSIESLKAEGESEITIQDLILQLTKKIQAKDTSWEKRWDETLNKLFVTEIYGFYRTKLKSFENHWEILYLKYNQA